MIDGLDIQEKSESLAPFLDEMQRRVWAATEARSLGWGGIAAAHRATCIAESTTRCGIVDLDSGEGEMFAYDNRICRTGAGRPSLADEHPGLSEALDSLIASETLCDPDVLTLHSDNGSLMKAKRTAQLLADLGLFQSLSCPHVSDDNPDFLGRFNTQGEASGQELAPEVRNNLPEPVVEINAL